MTNAVLKSWIVCEAEDQGGHRGCPIPATYQTKEGSYYCHQHRTNRHVWDESETTLMEPSLEQITALCAAYDELEDRLNKQTSKWYTENQECWRRGYETAVEKMSALLCKMTNSLLTPEILKDKLAGLPSKDASAGYLRALEDVAKEGAWGIAGKLRDKYLKGNS